MWFYTYILTVKRRTPPQHVFSFYDLVTSTWTKTCCGENKQCMWKVLCLLWRKIEIMYYSHNGTMNPKISFSQHLATWTDESHTETPRTKACLPADVLTTHHPHKTQRSHLLHWPDTPRYCSCCTPLLALRPAYAHEGRSPSSSSLSSAVVEATR